MGLFVPHNKLFPHRARLTIANGGGAFGLLEGDPSTRGAPLPWGRGSAGAGPLLDPTAAPTAAGGPLGPLRPRPVHWREKNVKI